MSLRSPVARARGLGSAKAGAAHWWGQRVTAVALVPLVLWFVISVVSLVAGAGHAEVRAWVANPAVAVLLISLVVATFWHLKLGLQVVIEDYVHGEPAKLAMLLLNVFGNFVLAVGCVLAVLKLALGA